VGLRDNNSNVSLVSLDDRVTMSGSLGVTEQCNSGACARQIEINQMNTIFFQIGCYIMQQPTQLISHLHSFLLTSIARRHARAIACDAEIIGGTPFLIRDPCDLSINGYFGTIFKNSFDRRPWLFPFLSAKPKKRSNRIRITKSKQNKSHTNEHLFVCSTNSSQHIVKAEGAPPFFDTTHVALHT
jgi:hypothetical protein